MSTVTCVRFLPPITFRKWEKFLLISLRLSHHGVTCGFLPAKTVKDPHLLTSVDSRERELSQEPYSWAVVWSKVAPSVDILALVVNML